MDDELQELVRRSVQQALTVAPDDIGVALAEFGWSELAATDESFAFTTLFEEQGYLGADTDALDVVTVAALGITEPAHVVWPLRSVVADDALAADELTVDGIALRRSSGTGHGNPRAGRRARVRARGVVARRDTTDRHGARPDVGARPRSGRAGTSEFRRVERDRAAGSPGDRQRARGRRATDRRHRSGPRPRAPPVRPAHRCEPGRAPPPGRGAQRRGRARGRSSPRHGKTGPHRPRRGRRPWPEPRRTRRRSTRSRCAVPSGSRRSTSCRGWSGAASRSTRCSARPRRCTSASARKSSRALRRSRSAASERAGRPAGRGKRRG